MLAALTGGGGGCDRGDRGGAGAAAGAAAARVLVLAYGRHPVDAALLGRRHRGAAAGAAAPGRQRAAAPPRALLRVDAAADGLWCRLPGAELQRLGGAPLSEHHARRLADLRARSNGAGGLGFNSRAGSNGSAADSAASPRVSPEPSFRSDLAALGVGDAAAAAALAAAALRPAGAALDVCHQTFSFGKLGAAAAGSGAATPGPALPCLLLRGASQESPWSACERGPSLSGSELSSPLAAGSAGCGGRADADGGTASSCLSVVSLLSALPGAERAGSGDSSGDSAASPWASAPASRRASDASAFAAMPRAAAAAAAIDPAMPTPFAAPLSLDSAGAGSGMWEDEFVVVASGGW